jgi:hypothetical protein
MTVEKKKNKFTCLKCDYSSNRRDKLKRHNSQKHPTDTAKHMYRCRHCTDELWFDTYRELEHHIVQNHRGLASTSSGAGTSHELPQQHIIEEPTQTNGVFNDTGLQLVYYPRRRTTNVRRYLEWMRPSVEWQLQQAVAKHKVIKWYIGICISFSRPPDERTQPPPWFNSNGYIRMEIMADPDNHYNRCVEKIM